MGHQKQRMSKKSVSSLSFRYLGAGVSAIKSWCSQDNLNSGSNSMQGQALSYPRLSHWVGIELYREATFEASAHRALLCLALWARLERLNGLGPSHSTQMSGLTSFTRPHCAQAHASHFGLKTLLSSSEAVVSRLSLLMQSTSTPSSSATETADFCKVRGAWQCCKKSCCCNRHLNMACIHTAMLSILRRRARVQEA